MVALEDKIKKTGFLQKQFEFNVIMKRTIFITCNNCTCLLSFHRFKIFLYCFCFNVGAKVRKPCHSFPTTLFCSALRLKIICLSFAPPLFCFALPLKKICLPFAPTVFMFHFSMTTIFTIHLF